MTAQWLGNSYAVTVKKTATPVLLWFHSYIGLACVMLSCLGAMVATVGFLRREPQDCNQSLCQKRAPWAPLRLIQPNNKQQITALACRQEQSPPWATSWRNGGLLPVACMRRDLTSVRGPYRAFYVACRIFHPSLPLRANTSRGS